MTPNIRPGRAAIATLVLFVFIFMLLWLCSGCVSFVRELKKAPYPMISNHSARVFGADITFEGYGLKLGFVSDTWTFIPTSTNTLIAPAYSSRLKIGQSGFDTSISEQTDSGFKDQPPPLALKLFAPKDRP